MELPHTGSTQLERRAEREGRQGGVALEMLYASIVGILRLLCKLSAAD